MMNFSAFVIYAMGIVLWVLALSRRDGCFARGLLRAVEHFGRLVPRMLCALVAAGFVAKLVPTETISRFLGADVGLAGILIGTLAGLGRAVGSRRCLFDWSRVRQCRCIGAGAGIIHYGLELVCRTPGCHFRDPVARIFIPARSFAIRIDLTSAGRGDSPWLPSERCP